MATALHRLSLRRQNYLSEKQFFAEEWERKIQVLAEKEDVSNCDAPTGTLDSFCADQSETTDLGSAGCLRGFMPEKLQIVKPLEGNKSAAAFRSCVSVRRPSSRIEICPVVVGALCARAVCLSVCVVVSAEEGSRLFLTVAMENH